jgi:hypothetical protein
MATIVSVDQIRDAIVSALRGSLDLEGVVFWDEGPKVRFVADADGKAFDITISEPDQQLTQ